MAGVNFVSNNSLASAFLFKISATHSTLDLMPAMLCFSEIIATSTPVLLICSKTAGGPISSSPIIIVGSRDNIPSADNALT